MQRLKGSLVSLLTDSVWVVERRLSYVEKKRITQHSAQEGGCLAVESWKAAGLQSVLEP